MSKERGKMSELPQPKCWKCEVAVDLIDGRVPFRAVCDGCGSWLHTCRGCRYYQPGLANSCMIPDTDPIADREMVNHCDEFAVRVSGAVKGKSGSDAARELFGDPTDDDTPSSIDSLFND
jgi:hypothetical protein